MLLKLCKTCNSLLPLIEFTKDKGNKDGLCYYCKSCTRDFCSIKVRKELIDKIMVRCKELRLLVEQANKNKVAYKWVLGIIKREK